MNTTQSAMPANAVVAPARRAVVGLDLSLTGTGVAIIDEHETVTRIVRSKGEKGATLADRSRRLDMLARRITYLVPIGALVVVEQPAYSQTGGSHHDRSGLWWLIVHELSNAGWDVAEVTPGGLKKYATGKGNAPKDAVLAAVVKRYPDIDITDNNVADAVVLAAMGARHVGTPIEASLPLANIAALDAVRWTA